MTDKTAAFIEAIRQRAALVDLAHDLRKQRILERPATRQRPAAPPLSWLVPSGKPIDWNAEQAKRLRMEVDLERRALEQGLSLARRRLVKKSA